MEEKKETVSLTDAQLDKAAGGRTGQDTVDPCLCPLCHMMTDEFGTCQNPICTNYGSYC